MKKLICAVLLTLSIFCLNNIQVFAENTQVNTATESTTVSEEKVEPSATVEPTKTSDIYIEDENDFYEPTTEYIPVENIELSDYNYEMYLNDTQDLSVTVFPQNATNQTVQYSSTNTNIATINQLGKLTAVGKGFCQICVTCDGFSVYYDLNVKVKTESIDVKNKFIVLKPGQKHNLEAVVQPLEASQNLNYKSSDESIAIVSNIGVIEAKSIGNTAIIVSNGDTTISVNVVVSAKNSSTTTDDNSNKNTESLPVVDALVKQVRNSKNNKIVLKNLDVLTSAVLKEIYGTDKEIIIECEDYDISIKGQDIFNAQNDLNTKLDISLTENSALIKFNEKNKLPGTISIKMKNNFEKYKYFYILDKSSNEYKKINSLSDNEIKVNSIGEYLLSTKNLNPFRINIIWILSAMGVILILSVIYI